MDSTTATTTTKFFEQKGHLYGDDRWGDSSSDLAELRSNWERHQREVHMEDVSTFVSQSGVSWERLFVASALAT
jgi:hypothetical protein